MAAPPPIAHMYINEHFNIFSTLLYWLTANFSEISFEIAEGILYEEISNINA